MRNRVSELSGDEVSILELKQGHRSFLHVYGALVAIVSYVPKETQRTQGQWDRYHVIIWRLGSTSHTARPVTCATHKRLQDGKRARRTTTIAAKSPPLHPALTPKPRTNGIDPIITRHAAPHRHRTPIRPPTPPRTAHPARLTPHGSPNLNNRTVSAHHPSEHAPTFPSHTTHDAWDTTPHERHAPGVRHALTHAEQPLRFRLTNRPDRVRWDAMRANRATGNLPAG